jgi:predicted PurR-regulated permease PerM
MSNTDFVRRVLLATGIVAAAAFACALAVFHPEVLLFAFAGMLAAILLDGLARPLLHLGMPRGAAIAVVVALALIATATAGALTGPGIARQFRELAEGLPQMIDAAKSVLSESAAGRAAVEATARASQSPESSWQRLAPYVLGPAAGLFSTSLGLAAGAVALIAVAVFLALQPERYVEAALRLLPRERRPRLREVLEVSAHALRRWIIGRAIAMAIVALITTIGLMLLGVELALLLGLLAGLLTFVPYAGPIASAVPALLVAFASADLMLAVGIAGLYTGVQMVENYLITPLVQGRMVSLPPAALIAAQVTMGVLLGVPGLVLATPLFVVLIVAVQALYLNDVLGERVPLLGQEADRRSIPARAPQAANRVH